MSDTDQCSRCGGDCPMTRCLECGGCENTGPGGTFRECPACQPAADGTDFHGIPVVADARMPAGHVALVAPGQPPVVFRAPPEDRGVSDPITFLVARLDEDEATAKAATPGPWIIRDGQAWLADNVVYGQSEWPDHIQQACNTDYAQHKAANATYIAIHDPARALREVEDNRKLIAYYEQTSQGDGRYDRVIAGILFLQIVTRTAIWRDHPDYRQEWKP